MRVLTAAQSSEWSGLLPPPSEYNRYPEDARRKMLEWNDAQILDASRRNDGLARGEIAQGRREQWFSFILNIAFLGAAFFSFAMTQNAASFGFLAVPGVTIAVNLYRGRRD